MAFIRHRYVIKKNNIEFNFDWLSLTLIIFFLRSIFKDTRQLTCMVGRVGGDTAQKNLGSKNHSS